MHLAALEHFLKNDERGQEILQSLEEGHEEKEAVETKVTLGGKFLDRILSPKSDRAYEVVGCGSGGSRKQSYLVDSENRANQ